SEPMAMRNGCSRDGDPVSVEKAGPPDREGNRGSPALSHPVRSLGRVEAQPLPRVTPYLLRRADSMCARRLSRMFEGGERSHDPAHRWRLRDAFLAAVRDVHAELAVPTSADFADVGGRLNP